MSFEVRATFPLDDEWFEKTELIEIAAAPFQVDFRGQGQVRDAVDGPGREVGFEVRNIQEAVRLRLKIKEVRIPGLVCVIREAMTTAAGT